MDDSLPPPIARILEAILFVGGAPLTYGRAKSVVRGLTADQFEDAIDEIQREYRRQNRPYHLENKGAGYIMALTARFQPVQNRLLGGLREARLSNAAVDVLALVAYRQPTTKAEVDSLRGAESGHLLRQLIRRGLVQVLQRGDSSQREATYGTTHRFLELFGLQSLDDLPRTEDLRQI
ncbi:MAG: SMC-Scp complex subunit ScpB [Gemmataceae bacterium]